MKSSSAIEALNLSKKYRLGTIGMTSLREDISRWWNKRNGTKQPVDFSKKLEIENSRMINEHEFWALNDLDFTISRGEVVETRVSSFKNLANLIFLSWGIILYLYAT